MNHDEILELLPLAAAGVLENNERARLEEHLRSCPDCSARLAGWRALAVSLRELPQPGMPSFLVERTIAVTRGSARDAFPSAWIGVLIAFSWILSFAGWAFVRWLLGGPAAALWIMLSGVLTISTAGVAAALLPHPRRNHEPLS